MIRELEILSEIVEESVMLNLQTWEGRDNILQVLHSSSGNRIRLVMYCVPQKSGPRAYESYLGAVN